MNLEARILIYEFELLLSSVKNHFIILIKSFTHVSTLKMSITLIPIFALHLHVLKIFLILFSLVIDFKFSPNGEKYYYVVRGANYED